MNHCMRRTTMWPGDAEGWNSMEGASHTPILQIWKLTEALKSSTGSWEHKSSCLGPESPFPTISIKSWSQQLNTTAASFSRCGHIRNPLGNCQEKSLSKKQQRKTALLEPTKDLKARGKQNKYVASSGLGRVALMPWADMTRFDFKSLEMPS